MNSNALQQFIETENAISECEKKFMIDNFHVKAEQLELLELIARQVSDSKNEVSTEA